MLDLGDTYTTTVTVTDATGTKVNAGSVTATITLPDLTTATPTVNNPSTGVYSISYPTTQSGLHQLEWVGTGANSFANSDAFNVAAVAPGFMISLADARAGLGFQATNTTSDEDLRLFISAATPIMEDLLGAAIPRSRTETHDGGSSQIALLYSPVMSVTSVIETVGSSYVRTLTGQSPFSGGSFDPFGYAIDQQTGIITRLAAGYPINFMAGLRNVQITYVSGRTLTGNHLLAARRVVKFLWQTEQQNYVPNQFSPESEPTALTPGGFEVPRIVLTLCADAVRPPGLA